jgi:hypothetical protein
MARPLRRPAKLSEMFPDSRLQEVTDLLGHENESLRTLKEMVAEDRYRERHRAELDQASGQVSAAASCWPPDAPDLQHDGALESSSLPAFMPADIDDGLPWVNLQYLVPGQVPEFQPFPVESLPLPVQQFVTAQANSLNCDTAAVALPVLSVLASAIGGTRRIELKRGWSEPAILWTALVNEGPSSHEAIIEAAIVPLQARQAAAEQERQEQFMPYRRKLAVYRDNQRRQPQFLLPPPEPIAERSLTVDWSLPSLTRLLSRQSRGLLVCPQELDGWLKKTSGAGERAAIQRQAWLDLYGGRSVTIEGRTTATLTPSAVSLTGTLSPDLFTQKFAKQGGACELTSRLLIASPEARPQCWTDDEVDQATEDGYASVINKLFALPGVVSGAPRTGCVTLSPEARDHIDMFMTDLGTRQAQIDEALFHWSSHLTRQAARLALVIHLSRYAAGEDVDPQQCDATSMQHGIALARWFAYEAQRVLKKVSLTAERRDLQQLYEWIRRHPAGSVTIRDVCRSNSRKYPTAQCAMAAMTKLKDSGLCQWSHTTPGHQGGRPTHRMEVIKKRKVTSDERKGTDIKEEVCREGVNATVTRPPAEVVSNTDERTTVTGRHPSA